MKKEQRYAQDPRHTFEVLERFVYCEGIYGTSSEVQCETVSCLQLILKIQQTWKIKPQFLA